MRIDARKMYRTNGLIDDFVLYGTPSDYLLFSELVQKAINTKNPIILLSQSDISIEITCDGSIKNELFTSLQNENNEYLSNEDWETRNILRLYANSKVLGVLSSFLKDLSGRGLGYSYLCEYSERYSYSNYSPEWRLHVENA